MCSIIGPKLITFSVTLFRYGSAYWTEMARLPTSHPTVYQEVCERGSWTLQHCENAPFGSVSADQAIEQTVNRDTKTSGGLKGITLKRGIKYLLLCGVVL